MHFALLQKTLERPDVERLKLAFRAVRGLMPVDAHTLANDAYGILIKNLSADDALKLQGALLVEGIETHVVLQSDLPQLPAIKFLRRMDCQPDALVIYDPIGRTIRIEWGHVMLIAAGSVRVTEFEQRRSLGTSPLRLEDEPILDVKYETKEEQAFRLLLEIVLTRATMRFQIEADEFLYTYLGDRATKEVVTNLSLLVQDLSAFAPGAVLNQGAFHLRERSDKVFEYPSKNAFYEEMTWILWRAANARQE